MLMRYGQYIEVYIVLATFMKRRKHQMIRARAVNKIYATRYGALTKNVIGYTLEDEQGNLLDVEKEQLKQAIKQRRIEVINITLTSDNRLMFKELNAISSKQSNKFVSTVSEEMKQHAADYESISNMIYDDVICECRASEKGLILCRVKSKGRKTETLNFPYLSVPVPYTDDAIEFSMPPEIRVVYNNAFKGTVIKQNEGDEPLDYSNIEYIGDYGIPDCKGIDGTRVRFGNNLRYLGYQEPVSIITDYLVINNNLKLYKNRLPYAISIGVLDITREDCSDIDIATYGDIGKLSIGSTVKKMKSRIDNTGQEQKIVSEKIYVEKLYISSQSGITKHNSFRYTNLDPVNVSKFNLKELNVPEEIFDDIVADSLRNLKYKPQTKYDLRHSMNKKLTDSEVLDMILNNIKQIARAYKVGTGRNLTERQKKKFVQVINRFEQYKNMEWK